MEARNIYAAITGQSLSPKPSKIGPRSSALGSIYITPGSPWEQAHVESFHDKLRDECLNRELFGSLAEARVILEQ